MAFTCIATVTFVLLLWLFLLMRRDAVDLAVFKYLCHSKTSCLIDWLIDRDNVVVVDITASLAPPTSVTTSRAYSPFTLLGTFYVRSVNTLV